MAPLAGATVTFNLYGPADPTGVGATVFTSTVSIGATVSSGSFTPTLAGTYHWIASYSGDANNAAVAGTCGNAGETSVVTPAAPSISTTAVTPVTVNSPISDSATVSGVLPLAGATVTFNLYGPADPTCGGRDGLYVDGADRRVNTVSSGSFTPTLAGTYHWIASYSGDANNAAVAGTCGNAGETSVVTPATPSIVTTATGTQLPAGTIHDVATLTGLSAAATGTVTFNLYGPSPTADVHGHSIFTSTKTGRRDGDVWFVHAARCRQLLLDRQLSAVTRTTTRSRASVATRARPRS